jgi:hypothetical protein
MPKSGRNQAERMQATARMASVVSSTFPALRRLILERSTRTSRDHRSTEMNSPSMAPSSSDTPLCDSCGLRRARNFITQIIHGEMTNSSLCDECAQAQQAPTGIDFSSIRDAKCYYCGDKAASGSLNQRWELPTRKQPMHYTCQRCMGLYHQFLLVALNAEPDGLPPEEQLRRMERVVSEVDSQVRAAL